MITSYSTFDSLDMINSDDKAPKPKRPGVKPTQFRLDESYRSRLDELVQLITAETGMKEDRTSVIRRLIAEAYRVRSISP